MKFKIGDIVYIKNNVHRKKYDDINDCLGIIKDYITDVTPKWIQSDLKRKYLIENGYIYIIK